MAVADRLRTAEKLWNSLSICFHALFLLLCWDFAVSYSTVGSLPGFPGPLPFQLETGYVSVDEGNDVQLFYYFVKSERNPKEDPLVLWLTGGPRCSSFSAFAFEIGPIYFNTEEYNGSLPTLMLNPNSWTKVSNIIFLDAPVGTGFSYSTLESSDIGDTKSAEDTHIFLRKWLVEHPEFGSNPLYICGDSYSGIIVPILVQEIINDIEAGQKSLLNLNVGYLIGNPVTNRQLEENAQVPFAHGMGFISDELYESMKRNCKGDYVNVDPNNEECAKDRELFTKCTSGINVVQVLEPLCFFATPKPEGKTGYRRSLEISREILLSQPLPLNECRSFGYLLSHYWANDNSVREALTIKKGTVEEWKRCNYDLPYKAEFESIIEYHRNLSTKGYRSLIYSGDHDMWVSHLSTEAWIRSLNLSIVDDWHQWLVSSQIAGYTRTYSNGLTYATVKGGGHTAPEYRPKECFSMFERWISYNPL